MGFILRKPCKQKLFAQFPETYKVLFISVKALWFVLFARH